METSKITTTVIMYHNGCPDGFGAAAVAHMYYQSVSHNFPEGFQVIYYPINAGETHVSKAIDELIEWATDIDHNTVEILSFDLSMDYNCIAQLLTAFPNARIYDHHKCTLEQALDLTEPPKDAVSGAMDDFFAMKTKMDEQVVFKNDHSGAYLAYEHYYPHEVKAGRVPALISYIEDRDIWRWALPDSKLINAGLYETLRMKYDYNEVEDDAPGPDGGIPDSVIWFTGFAEKTPQFDTWIEFLHSNDWIEPTKEAGRIVENVKNRIVKQQSHLGGLKIINHEKVLVCNATVMFSELGSYCYEYKVDPEQAEGTPKDKPEKVYAYDYVLMWRYDMSEDKVMVSMRSRSPKKENDIIVDQGGTNVNHIANTFPGGGGHDHAAGFECSLKEFLKFVGTDLD